MTIEIRTIELFRKIVRAAAPPARIAVSEWADQNRILSRETSAEPGPWRTARTPYLKDIMDAVTDRFVEEIVLQFASQTGKSDGAINNVIGYFVDIDPCPMLLIQPTTDMAEDYSKRRIAPMIRDTPVLADKIADSKTRDTNNTILNKVFPGGSLTLSGANSPAGLASRNIRIILADEIDRYPESAGTEGDPLLLAEKRTITFPNRKKIYVSTPGIKGVSRIEAEYMAGTQEKWCLKCPNCGEYQFLNLHGMKFQYRKDEKDNYSVWDLAYQCPDCGFKYDEQIWKRQEGAWIAENPGAKKIRSFHLNAFYSPWLSWEEIILEWLKVKKDPERLKVFVNTMLGLPWEEKGDIDDETIFLERREEYKAQLPDGVLTLTMSVDTQDDRLEYEVVGWGKGEESWGIEKATIWGKPDDKSTWQRVDDLLDRRWSFTNGSGLILSCTCIDSGGHFTDDVYKYCKKRLQRRVFPIKGMGGDIPFIHKISRNNQYKLPLIMLGVDSGKTMIMQRLKIKQPGDKFFHFPSQEERGYDQTYFKGLIAERQVLRKTLGQPHLVWENIATDKRNEPLDLRVYNLAALRLLKPDFEALERRLKENSGGAGRVESKPKKRQKQYGCIKKSE